MTTSLWVGELLHGPPAGHGQPATFGLRTATPRDYDAFEAPPDPWRIDSGVNAVLA